MSSIMNKVKEAMSSDNKNTTASEGTYGTHNSRTANAADPRIDSDIDNRGTHDYTGNTGTYTTGETYTTTGARGLGPDGPATKTDGPHKSNLLNKADPRVDSDRDYSRNMGANPHGTDGTGAHNVGTGNTFAPAGTTTTASTGTTKSGVSEGTFGPHSNRTANAVDPRVDSDLDSRRTHGTTTTTGTSGLHSGAAGTTGLHSGAVGNTGRTGYDSNVPEGTFGPHGSRVANAADPRVDSDLDSRRTHGTTTTTTGTSGLHSGATRTTAGTGTHSSAFGSTGRTGYDSNVPEGTFGPHGSRTANAVDPRVDSDLDNRRTHDTTTTTTGTSGLHSGAAGTTGLHSGAVGSTGRTGYDSNVPEGTFGPHSSRTANAADPRVDSDLDSRRTHGTTHGTTTTTTGTHSVGGAGGIVTPQTVGQAPNTAGPHKSDMMNKLDPRVDSNLDGSKTIGGDKTFTQSNGTHTAAKDPTDAAQVPPSVLRKHVGGPVIAHDDHEHDRERRHSLSHQTQHRGL